MARKKSKAKKVATALLATVVLLGAAGTLAVGAMTDWSFKSEDLLPFKDVKIEAEQTKVYTVKKLLMKLLKSVITILLSLLKVAKKQKITM